MLILIYDNSENGFSFLLEHFIDNEDLSIIRMLKIVFFSKDRLLQNMYIYIRD